MKIESSHFKGLRVISSTDILQERFMALKSLPYLLLIPLFCPALTRARKGFLAVGGLESIFALVPSWISKISKEVRRVFFAMAQPWISKKVWRVFLQWFHPGFQKRFGEYFCNDFILDFKKVLESIFAVVSSLISKKL